MTTGVALELARAAKQNVAAAFRPLVGEVAVGVEKLSADRYGLKVNLSAPPSEGVTLPSEVDGVPVRVEVVGTIRKR